MRLTKQSELTAARAFEDGCREARIPGIIAPEDGSVLLCCEARAEKKGDWGDIDIRVLRYENGEITEVFRAGESRLPPDGSLRTYNNPVLIDGGNGRVILLFCKNYERVFVTASEDCGRTWDETREITSAFRGFDYDWNVCAVGPGHGLRAASGRLIVPVWLAKGALHPDGTRDHWPSVSGSVYSDDGGKTWRAGFRFDGALNSNETSAALLPDESVLFSFRNMNPDKQRILALSRDGGETLSAPHGRLTDPGCFGGLTGIKNGALHVNCQSVSRRENLTVSFSEDGARWEPAARIAKSAGYADICARGNMLFIFREETDFEKGMIGRLALDIYKTETE